LSVFLLVGLIVTCDTALLFMW